MKTLAIVIGNNNYYKDAKLENAINDAEAIAKVFTNLGYDVITGYDCSINDCVKLLQTFEEKIAGYDATIFYFAGHGFQLDGENYLASIECQVTHPNKYHCSKSCITLTEVLGILRKHTQKTNIVIIDACRRSFERGGDNSFTPIQAPKGTLIAFSTSPNEGAMDQGIEGHSIYTGALLKYIGREWISVEELFKKVRKTVYNLSEGKQTTWEHTSLIGDFIFNKGQLVYSMAIPYDETVVKDSTFKDKGDEFSSIIIELKSSNWNRQNPAIERFLKIPPAELDKNQQFIFGRNILQAGDCVNGAIHFLKNLKNNLAPYIVEGENHILNGILFEIYFDSHGEFRNVNLKKHCFEEVIALRKDPAFANSFEFLKKVLEPYMDFLFYFPSSKNEIIDVDVLATSETAKDFLGDEKTYQVISKVKVGAKDITKEISRYGIHGSNQSSLQNALSNYFGAPSELIQVNANIELKNLAFQPTETFDF